MNLKTACIISLVMTLVSILLTISGNALFYTVMFTENFHISMLISAIVGILTFLAESGGFIILLRAMITRLRSPDTNTKTLFVLAAVLILLGVLISTGFNMFNAVPMLKHLPYLQVMLYMAIYIFIFLSGLTLGLLSFTQSDKTSSGKSLAAAAFATRVVLLALILISNAIHFQYFFKGPDFLQTVGSTAMILGYIINPAAVIFFLFMFLKHRPWPPLADVADSSPGPLPTLSAEAPIPEQE